MSRVTIYLSRLIGLVALLVALAMLVQEQAVVETAAAIVHDRPLRLVVGVIQSVVGLAMVLAHNVWTGGALPVVVTLVGWSILFRGLILLSLPADAMVRVFDMLHLEQFFYVYVVISLALGLYLTYGGFKRSLPSNADSNR